jgi:SAM-dependent methyltransferase
MFGLARKLSGLTGNLRTPNSAISSQRARASWSKWPVWIDESHFRTQNFLFSGSVEKFDGTTSMNSVAILKHKQFIDIYRALLFNGADYIFEIGYFQGGMALFLSDMIYPKKIVSIDRLPLPDKLDAAIACAKLQDVVRLYGNVLQDDVSKTKEILSHEFGSQALELIIDDCSHEYLNSKICFEEYFGYLKPGGRYIIEDWGWLHWPGEPWQSPQSPFSGKPGLTNLVFELIMTLGTCPDIISRVEVLSEFCVVVTRGPRLKHGEKVNLGQSYLTAGRKFSPM